MTEFAPGKTQTLSSRSCSNKQHRKIEFKSLRGHESKTVAFCKLGGLSLCRIIVATENIVSVEHACYCLQFCPCYASFYVWQEASSYRLLFAGNLYVKNVSVVATYVFPLIFSQALINGIHLSPYMIPITFASKMYAVESRL